MGINNRLFAERCRLPLILITGLTDDATRVMTERVNTVAVLTKPFSRDSQLTAIRQGLASGRDAQ